MKTACRQDRDATMEKYTDGLENIHKVRKKPSMQGTNHNFRRKDDCVIKTESGVNLGKYF